MEFSAIYRNWEELKLYAGLCGIKCTTLKPECEFLYDMLKREVKNRDGSGVHYGYSWCGGVCRWGTTAKLKALDKYCEERGLEKKFLSGYIPKHRKKRDWEERKC